MAAHARSESARRVSDCVTALLRDQPFFGSLALRLPIRADATRETLASDGKDIRYAPQWVVDTDADRIKTALARVVLACALKHHTRRGGRDPERWQRASQLVTNEYYTAGEEPDGVWFNPKGLLGLADSGKVDSSDFHRLYNGFAPNTGAKLTQNAGSERRSAGLDMTFSADKSVCRRSGTACGDRGRA